MYADLEQAENWYVVCMDGLHHLETAIHAGNTRRLTLRTLEQIRFIRDDEWRDFLRDREEEHEMYASLALLATCEGGIRRDAEWRSAAPSRPAYFAKFQALRAQPEHVSIHAILDTWQAALGPAHPFRGRLDQLRGFYRDRNLLAHGRAQLGEFAFAPIFDALAVIRGKWKSFVPDFQGF